MLQGCDISHWNSINKVLKDEQDFVIFKATEGVKYVDKKMLSHYQAYTGLPFIYPSTKLYGFYHYARPEKNQPVEEADLFLKTIAPHIGNCIMALDVEGVALNYIPWTKMWLDYVYKKTGIKPLIYIQGSATNTIQTIKDSGYGLWVAHYTKELKKPNIGVYPFYALWQYTSKPYDRDFFNGNEEQFKKYCRG